MVRLRDIISTKRNCVIEESNIGDYSALSEIHSSSFSRGWTDGEFDALLSQDFYTCLVARKPGAGNAAALGFVVLKTVLDEAEIITIATGKKSRRKGIAETLLLEAIRRLEADRIKSLFLDVEESNKAAIGLYHKLGFEEFSRREGYYANAHSTNNNPSAALVMRLDLG